MRYENYQRLYRNAKAKERRLNKNHNVQDIGMKLLTPTEFKNSRNKKREIDKLERFTDRGNTKFQYVRLGKESIKKKEYMDISKKNQRLISQINYHDKKSLREVKNLPYFVFDSLKGEPKTSNQAVNQRISNLQQRMMDNTKNRSRMQTNAKALNRYTKELDIRLKRIKDNAYANIQKSNYLDKLKDFSPVFKSTKYANEYKKFMKEMKNLSPQDYEKFYYLSDMGDIAMIEYVSEEDLETPEGQEKIYKNMKAIWSSWHAVKKAISS